MKMSNLGASLLLLTLLSLTKTGAHAQSRDWTGAVNDDWEGFSNWSPTGVPLTNETINIGTNADPNETSVLNSNTVVTVENMNLSRNSELELRGDLTASNLMDIDEGSKLFMTGSFYGSSPTLKLTRSSGTSLRNDGTIHINRRGGIIDSGYGASLDLDGSTGDGHILLESSTGRSIPSTSLQIKGPLSDAFNGILEFNGNAGDSNDSTVFDVHDAWEIGNGGQVLFGGTRDSRILGGALTATGALFDLQNDAWIEAPVTFLGSTITGSSNNKLSLTKSASFSGGPTIDQWVEVQGVGEITGASQMRIDSSLDFLDSANVSDSNIHLNSSLRMFNGGSIQNSNIAPSNSATGGLITYTGPLTIGGNSNLDVDVLWNEGTNSPLTINGGEVSAKNWANTDLRLLGGDARVKDVGNISLPGGLSFGSDETPSLSIEAGSTATIGPTGNGDLTLGFLNGDFAELFVDGIGRTSPGNPNRASQLSAGNGRLGNRGQGVLVTRNGGRTNFSGNVKVGEQFGALGAMTVHGVVDDGTELFQSQVHIGDPEDNIIADLEVGNAGEGYVTILDGGRVSVNGDAHFGRNSGGSGSLTVANSQLGRDSFFDVDGDIHMGGDGAASASMNHGGVITANSLLLKSRGAFYQGGGVLAAQTLDISDEGVASITDGDAYLQNFSRSGTGVFNHTGGDVFIQGGTAAFNSSYAFSGPDQANQPRLIVESGTDATVTYAFRVGEQAGEHGQAMVYGATTSGRSTLRGTGGGAGADLHVGRFGSGGLHIEDGGYVQLKDDTLIASEAGSFGILGVLGTTQLPSGAIERAELDVTGRGAQSSLYIGQKGHGILSLGQGGLVRVAGSTAVATAPDSRGEIHVFTAENGLPAELDIAGNLTLGGEGEATMNLYEGGVVKATNLNMGANSTLNMTGGLLELDTLNATNGITNFAGGDVDIDTIVGDVDFDNVNVLPGDSPGWMQIQGSTVFNQTTLEIEIGGLQQAVEYDLLTISGTAALDGTLDLQLYDLGNGPFAPQLGDAFSILTAEDGITGEFDTIVSDALPAGLDWDVDYLLNEVRVSVVSNGPIDSADFDLDGDIDAYDLSKWEADYGGRGSDADGDGITAGSDFLALQRQFTGSARPKVAATAVPEPAGLVLMLMGLFGVLATERRAVAK